jgi:hypothetical protein
MATGRHGKSGSLLATALGVAALSLCRISPAQAPPTRLREEPPRPEVTVTASRETDAILTAKVEQALQDDRYLFSAHMSVVTENGIVRLQGIAIDVSDLRRALFLARRIAGRRRVVNELELISVAADHD